MMDKMKRHIAFTLAEVIIVLGIIGIVAEMTIPSLMSSYQKQLEIVQLKEVYSQLSQAMLLLKANEEVDKISDSDVLTLQEFDDWPTAMNRAGGFLKDYFKVVKDCGTDPAKLCFAQDYYSIDKTTGPTDPNTFGYYRVITSNGTSIGILIADLGRPGLIIIDLNGLKKPNIAGRDLFSISYYYDGSVDESINPECRKGLPNKSTAVCQGYGSAAIVRDTRSQYCITQNSQVYGMGCFDKILNDGWKMDY